MGQVRSFIILTIIFIINYDKVFAQVNDTFWKGFSVTCTNEELTEVNDVSVSCHGIRLVRRIVQRLLEEAKKKRSLDIFDGISLVEKDDYEDTNRSGRVLKESGPFGSVMNFLESRELRIKLPTFLPSNFEAAIEHSLPSIDQGRGHGGGGGGFGGGGKKGDGGVMLVVLMMGKMMAAMGFGALGLLAMKALMVSSLALMLSLIVAAKKLASSKDDHDSHHVVYAQEVSHHRRRRSLDNNLENNPYRGYLVPTDMLLKS